MDEIKDLKMDLLDLAKGGYNAIIDNTDDMGNYKIDEQTFKNALEINLKVADKVIELEKIIQEKEEKAALAEKEAKKEKTANIQSWIIIGCKVIGALGTATIGIINFKGLVQGESSFKEFIGLTKH